MTFANIITKAKNIVGKVFVQHSNALVSISDLLIKCFISSFCFADGFIIRNSGCLLYTSVKPIFSELVPIKNRFSCIGAKRRYCKFDRPHCSPSHVFSISDFMYSNCSGFIG